MDNSITLRRSSPVARLSSCFKTVFNFLLLISPENLGQYVDNTEYHSQLYIVSQHNANFFIALMVALGFSVQYSEGREDAALVEQRHVFPGNDPALLV